MYKRMALRPEVKKEGFEAIVKATADLIHAYEVKVRDLDAKIRDLDAKISTSRRASAFYSTPTRSLGLSDSRTPLGKALDDEEKNTRALRDITQHLATLEETQKELRQEIDNLNRTHDIVRFRKIDGEIKELDKTVTSLCALQTAFETKKKQATQYTELEAQLNPIEDFLAKAGQKSDSMKELPNCPTEMAKNIKFYVKKIPELVALDKSTSATKEADSEFNEGLLNVIVRLKKIHLKAVTVFPKLFLEDSDFQLGTIDRSEIESLKHRQGEEARLQEQTQEKLRSISSLTIQLSKLQNEKGELFSSLGDEFAALRRHEADLAKMESQKEALAEKETKAKAELDKIKKDVKALTPKRIGSENDEAELGSGVAALESLADINAQLEQKSHLAHQTLDNLTLRHDALLGLQRSYQEFAAASEKAHQKLDDFLQNTFPRLTQDFLTLRAAIEAESEKDPLQKFSEQLASLEQIEATIAMPAANPREETELAAQKLQLDQTIEALTSHHDSVSRECTRLRVNIAALQHSPKLAELQATITLNESQYNQTVEAIRGLIPKLSEATTASSTQTVEQKKKSRDEIADKVEKLSIAIRECENLIRQNKEKKETLERQIESEKKETERRLAELEEGHQDRLRQIEAAELKKRKLEKQLSEKLKQPPSNFKVEKEKRTSSVVSIRDEISAYQKPSIDPVNGIPRILTLFAFLNDQYQRFLTQEEANPIRRVQQFLNERDLKIKEMNQIIDILNPDQPKFEDSVLDWNPDLHSLHDIRDEMRIFEEIDTVIKEYDSQHCDLSHNLQEFIASMKGIEEKLTQLKEQQEAIIRSNSTASQ